MACLPKMNEQGLHDMKKICIYTTLILISHNVTLLAQSADDTLVTNFAIQSVLSTFSYDSQSYKKQIANLKNKFTQQGWRNFSSALSKSGNVDAVIKNSMVVSAYKNGDVSIESYAQNEEFENWVVKVPTMVTYSNEYVAIDQPLVSYISIDKNNNTLRIANINSEMAAPSTTQNNLPKKRPNCHNE